MDTLQVFFLLTTSFALGKSALVSSPKTERIYVEDGSKTAITLMCKAEAKGVSASDLDWSDIKNTNAHQTVSYHGSTGSTRSSVEKSLVFEKFEASKDAGKYKCQYQSESAEFELIPLEVSRQEQEFDFENKSVSSQTLKCNVKAMGQRADGSEVEVKSVRWFQNDEPVENLKEADRFETDPAKPEELKINEIARIDANQYYAEYTFKGPQEDKYNCSVAFKGKPLVLDFDKSKNLIQDEKMVLQCNVLGFPKAEVSWKKDSVEMVAKEDEVALSSLNGYKNAMLTIKSVDYDDAGDYSCTAYEPSFNESDTKVITVRVKDKLAALWPFLGIVGEVIVLCFIIFIYEKRRNKQAEQAENDAQDADYAEKKGNVRNRRNMK